MFCIGGGGCKCNLKLENLKKKCYNTSFLQDRGEKYMINFLSVTIIDKPVRCTRLRQ